MSEQTAFDFLLPYRKATYNTQETAAALGRSLSFVYKLMEDGKLEFHGVPGREVSRARITRRSIAAYLAETAVYNPAYFYERVEALLTHLDATQLHRLAASAEKLRAAKLQAV